MNAKLATDTQPIASSKNDALVLDIAHHLHSLASQVAETITMSPADAAVVMGEILSRVNHEYMRLGSAREVMYEFAAVESDEEAERRWNNDNNGGMS